MIELPLHFLNKPGVTRQVSLSSSRQSKRKLILVAHRLQSLPSHANEVGHTRLPGVGQTGCAPLPLSLPVADRDERCPRVKFEPQILQLFKMLTKLWSPKK
jgi:hypothetical protein